MTEVDEGFEKGPRPLPPNSFRAGDVPHQAYEYALKLESRDNLSGRILGYMLLYAPNGSRQATIAQEIVESPTDNERARLASSFKHFLIHRLVNSMQHTPTHSARSSLDNQQLELSEEAPSLHACAKAAALERDSFRCLVSGKVDIASLDSALTERRGGEKPGVTHAAHIFPEFLGRGEEELNREYTAGACAVMRMFSGIDLGQELNGARVDRLENTLTLHSDIQNAFDRLRLWLEPLKQESTAYCVRAIGAARGYLEELPSNTTEISGQNGHPRPDPRYLCTHAACCKVANLSGAGQYVEQILRDIERGSSVPSEDGNTAELLLHALSRVSAH
ncbi:hypothetical protein BOTBODRAFT_184748 [Botryobasidium botryosum FD-172 SS1]|uniref:HNH nuclease domain-containing protein n=1 Tax=Botryobasidium botryosum (strain FD-172 SS1) TaxID=930990 RepID=A0A067MT70_BOTB1|nr:hypothetical protein BOTBODRAFT_184748 [Botryobasidium botryosum FD-172 SS1]